MKTSKDSSPEKNVPDGGKGSEGEWTMGDKK